MGYTNYWDIEPKTAKLVKAINRDEYQKQTQALVNSLNGIQVPDDDMLAGSQGETITIRKEYDEDTTPPQVFEVDAGEWEGKPYQDLVFVRFNGVGIDGDETFMVSADELVKEQKAFAFCKTARKPYDYAVKVMLIHMFKIGVITRYSYDGGADELINPLMYYIEFMLYYAGEVCFNHAVVEDEDEGTLVFEPNQLDWLLMQLVPKTGDDDCLWSSVREYMVSEDVQSKHNFKIK
jgi:hypothetical protein